MLASFPRGPRRPRAAVAWFFLSLLLIDVGVIISAYGGWPLGLFEFAIGAICAIKAWAAWLGVEPLPKAET
jgi:hypothetical protein